MANDGTVKIGTEVDESGFKSGLSKLGSIAKTAMVGVTAATVAATAAIGGLTKAAVDGYAEYEQLAGGVETLFKTSSDKVMEYANNAYKTAGMSANEYMETVTSFSASLLQGLGGDTAAAADLADQAIIDMSDNANKMGTDISMIQNAYQGFAKQNYTMLDNLKLGYGGTQAEMARLINDSGVLGDTIEVTANTVNDVSFDKIIEAIHVVQTNMGITGTTAAEAADTIEGSANAMKATWSNLVTGLADDNADLDTLITNFVDSVATYAENIIPVIEQALSGIGELITKLAPMIAEKLPEMISAVLPSLLEAGVSLLQYIASGLQQGIPELIARLPEIISSITSFLAENLPAIASAGADIIRQLAHGFEQARPVIAEELPKIIASAIDFLTEHLPEIVAFGVEIINSLVNGIIEAIPAFVAGLPELINSFTAFIVEAAPLILDAGVNIIKNLIDGIVAAIPDLVAALPEIIDSIVGFLVEAAPQILLTGAQLILALIGGIVSAIPDLVAALPQIISAIADGLMSLLGGLADVGLAIVQAIWDGIVGGIKSLLGIGGGGSGGTPKSGGGSPRRAPPSPPAPSDDGGDPGPSAYSLSRAAPALETAMPTARDRMISDLAAAMPAAQSRVAIATADMAPSAGYSAPPPASYSGGNAGDRQQQPIILRPNWTMRFEGELAQFAQVFKPVIDAEDARVGQGVQ